MKIKYWIDEKFKEPELLICADQKTKEVEKIREKIAETLSVSIIGYTTSGAELLSCNDIIRIYAEGERVYAECKNGVYTLKKKLYEMEQNLPEEEFVRISRAELVNVHKIKRLYTGMTGTIKMYLQGDIETYVSRRNVGRIKVVLHI